MDYSVKLIALDLDGTLLNSEKELTAANFNALAEAAAKGVEIVPATGRFYGSMPRAIQDLPFVRYTISINGAHVMDLQRKSTIYEAKIATDRALTILAYLDTLPVLYDCYMDDWGWMSRSHWGQIGEYITNVHNLQMMREFRRPVPNLKDWVQEQNHGVQKIQLYVQDMRLHQHLLQETLPQKFPDMVFSTSTGNNIEINHSGATKGAALARLAAHLGYAPTQTAAFGDSTNDRTMILWAGKGIAMGNACPEIAAIADFVTADCDHDGAAEGIRQYCLL